MSTETIFVEKAIIAKLIGELAQAGFVPVNVWDSEEYQPAVTTTAVIDVLYAVDAFCTVHFAPVDNLNGWGKFGVLLVTGNGCDIISDYHSGNPQFEAALERVADWIDHMVYDAVLRETPLPDDALLANTRGAP